MHHLGERMHAGVGAPGAGRVNGLASDLVLTVKAPGADRAAVQAAADGAKAGCPISRLLSNIEITLTTTIDILRCAASRRWKSEFYSSCSTVRS